MSTAKRWRASQKKKWLRGQMEGDLREVYDPLSLSFFYPAKLTNDVTKNTP